MNPSRSYASTQGKLKRELNAYKIFFACQLQAQLSSWSAASARVLGCLGFLTGLLFLRSYGCLDLPTHTYTYIYICICIYLLLNFPTVFGTYRFKVSRVGCCRLWDFNGRGLRNMTVYQNLDSLCRGCSRLSEYATQRKSILGCPRANIDKRLSTYPKPSAPKTQILSHKSLATTRDYTDIAA